MKMINQDPQRTRNPASSLATSRIAASERVRKIAAPSVSQRPIFNSIRAFLSQLRGGGSARSSLSRNVWRPRSSSCLRGPQRAGYRSTYVRLVTLRQVRTGEQGADEECSYNYSERSERCLAVGSVKVRGPNDAGQRN
jgi:hypothetical protein